MPSAHLNGSSSVTALSTDEVAFDFKRDDGQGGTQSLVQIRTSQTLSDPDSGVEAGRGAIRLIDNVRSGGRTVELGFYEYGCTLIADLQTGEPFEMWIDSGVVSLKGNDTTQNSHRLEIRLPSDASGLNLEMGRKANASDGTLAGWVYCLASSYPLIMESADGTRVKLGPTAGAVEMGGENIAGANDLNLRLLSGQGSANAEITLGYWNSTFAVNSWKIRKNTSQNLMLGYWASGAEDATKSMYLFKEGNMGIFSNSGVGGGVGVIKIGNATTVPASNPTSGGLLYVESGALKYRGSSGTITTLAPA